jgi:hypothetical protein
MELLNVFEHQLFLLRRPDGTRLKKSFREIVTEPDTAYALDYPQEFFNVDALSLMAYLAQVAFEPETVAELAERVRNPLNDAEFEAVIAPLRTHFLLNGDGPRFMQGPPPLPAAESEPLSVVVMIAPKGERQFLYRPNVEWGIASEQAGLLLFMRNTFYEGTGGRTYQKGVNGDTPVRTMVTIQGGQDTLLLRQSVWLNVLSRSFQRDQYEGDYGQSNEPDVYNGYFWETPPIDTVPVGKITVRAALGWMTAFHWLHFEEIEGEKVCPVTGEPTRGVVAERTSKRSSGIAYGTKSDTETGISSDRFFRHPNVPTHRTYYDKKAEIWRNEQAFLVDRTRGFVNAMGSAFFGATSNDANNSMIVAPVVAQSHSRFIRQLTIPLRLLVFGFNMLPKRKRNVHGGYEIDTFRMPLLGVDDMQKSRLQSELARQWINAAANTAEEIGNTLQRTIQIAAGVGVRVKTDEKGAILLVKVKLKSIEDYDFGRDVLTGYWRDMQRALAEHALYIAEEATDASSLADFRVQTAWNTVVRRLAQAHFDPIFDRYHVQTRTMPLAFIAQKILHFQLNKHAPLPAPAEA